MTTFAYVALEPSGRRRTGVVEASDQKSAIAQLEAEGRYVVELREDKGAVAKVGKTAKASGRKASGSDLALFTRRLADLSGAGLPLDRVLQILGEQSESPQLVEVSEQALKDVRGGMPVSEALAQHPRLFSDMFTQTLRAGEASGQFPQTASRLADFQEMEVTRRSQITSALVYPGVLTFTAVTVVVLLLTFVIPKLAPVFRSMGDNLPAPTKLLLASTAVLTQYWWAVVLGIVGLVLAYRAFVATEAGAITRDHLILRLPVVGPIFRKATISRFSRTLGTLVYGGVPILEAIRLASLAAGNRVYRKAGSGVEQEVRDGRPIAVAMRDVGVFPPVLTHMVAIGEETGDLPKMLGRVADSLDFEVDQGLRRTIAFFEPAIVLVMAVFVGFVVLSVVLPIFEAQQLVK